MKRYLRLGLVLVFVIAAVAANLVWNRDVPRETVVLSEFVNLGADPGAGGIVKLDFLVSNAARAARRETRLAHIHPDLLTAQAEAAGITTQTLTRQIIAPDIKDPFDVTGVQPPITNGQTPRSIGPWRTRVLQGNEEEMDESAAGDIWVIYFTDAAWFYAPLTTDADRTTFVAAHPELAELVSP